IPSMYGPNRKINKLAERRRQMWINALKRADLTETKIKYARVCSKHFISGTPASLTDETNPDWVPSKKYGIYFQSQLNTSNVHLQENSYQPMDVEELQEVSVESLQLALQNANKEIYSLREEISKFKLNEE
ncbi:hypothetical protein NQ314_016923, partial [Rhamnusium bicolor]